MRTVRQTVRVVAEFGQSHRGDLDRAMEQAKVARDAGCWAVKWQVFDPARIASKYASRYWSEHLGGSDSQLETFAQNGMLSWLEWKTLASHCQDLGIEFLATPFDLEAVDLLEDIGVATYKIASGDLTYTPLLEKVGRTGKPVFLSTGASYPFEVARALRNLWNTPQVTLLACTLAYPTVTVDANLARIGYLWRTFPSCQIGYSDHTLRTDTALAAVVAGATVLEKHCTLTQGGTEADFGVPDDRMGLSPGRLNSYVAYARLAEDMLGTGGFAPIEAEKAARVGARRSGYATRTIVAGEMIMSADVAWLRPSDVGGFASHERTDVCGRRARWDIPAGELVRRDTLE
jgi:sialic acid synthase SpsE